MSTAQNKLFFLLSLISLMLIFLDSKSLLNLPKGLIQNLTIPIQYGVYQTSKTITSQFDFIFISRSLWQENRALKKQLAEILVENATLQQKIKEQQALILQKEALDPQKFNLTEAKILGLGRTLILDKGGSDGVEIGDTVLFKDTFLGTIHSISPKSSTVKLITDSDSKVAVFSQNKIGKARGILTGELNLSLKMEKILQQESIFEGDLIFTEGLGEKLPRGLVVGTVTKVTSQQGEIFKSAQISPIFDLNDLSLVFILKK